MGEGEHPGQKATFLLMAAGSAFMGRLCRHLRQGSRRCHLSHAVMKHLERGENALWSQAFRWILFAKQLVTAMWREL